VVRSTLIGEFQDLPPISGLGHTGDGKFDGETFLGRLWMFFLGGSGGEEEESGHVNRVGFRLTTCAFEQTSDSIQDRIYSCPHSNLSPTQQTRVQQTRHKIESLSVLSQICDPPILHVLPDVLAYRLDTDMH
jgi:hypothetical protein